MPLDLHVAIDNAHDALTTVVPAYASGQYLQPNLPHAIGIYFRQLGTCRMLMEGVAAPVFQAQMQAAGEYLFRLPKMADEDKVTSLAAVFWDAVAGGYTSAARDIAIHSRRTPNLDREQEDDFLYVIYLMQRYFLRPTDADAEAIERHAGEQAARLARWAAVLEEGDDPRLGLCKALQDGDSDAREPVDEPHRIVRPEFEAQPEPPALRHHRDVREHPPPCAPPPSTRPRPAPAGDPRALPSRARATRAPPRSCR